MFNKITYALVCIAKKLTNNKDGSCKIFTEDGAIYIFNEFNDEFSFLYQPESYHPCDCNPCISIKINEDGIVKVDIFNYCSKKELSERIERMYNIIMDNLRLNLFWKGYKK